MTIKTRLFFSLQQGLPALFLLLLTSTVMQAQQLLVVNGGIFGSLTEKANLGVFNPQSGIYTHIDTIFTNSIQDIIVEADRYAYIAAQDSIVKYDLWSGQRMAATAFGAASTIKLGLYNNKLLVGNWYGASSGNLRIFDKNTLTYQSDIPEITKGAQDFAIVGNRAYVAQNNSSGTWSDTLGYLAIVDLSADTFVRNDTLSTIGEEVGRLVNVGDTAIYSLNSVTNTISYYHIASTNANTVLAAAVLAPKSYGRTAYQYGDNAWYMPFNSGIGTFDLVSNSVVTGNIVNTSGWGGTAFAVDTVSNLIFVSYINYANQSLNQGIYYNNSGDSLGVFPAGLSPEVLGVWYSNISLASDYTKTTTVMALSLFPNPAAAWLNLKSTTDFKAIRISDMQGSILRFSEFNATDNQVLNVEQLPAGSYFLTIWNEAHQSKTAQFTIVR